MWTLPKIDSAAVRKHPPGVNECIIELGHNKNNKQDLNKHFYIQNFKTHLELVISFCPPRLLSRPNLVKMPTRTMMATTPQIT